MRVSEEEVLRRHQADKAEQCENSCLALGHRPDLLDHHRLADGVEDRAARVHRLVRVLEDHLRPAAVLLDLLALHQGDVALVLAVAEPDAAAGRLVQLHEHPARRRLAAPGLPDQAEALAGRDLEADAVDGVDEVGRRAEEPARDREPHLEVRDLEERWPPGRLRRRLGDRARRRHRWRCFLELRDLVVVPAGDSVAATDIGQRRLIRRADVRGERAARVEAAAGRRSEEVRRLSLQRRELPTRTGDRGRRAQEQIGVRVARSGEDLRGWAVLDELAGVHHAERVGHFGDDGDVVADVDDRHPHLGLDPLQLLEDLVLDDDVEGGGRLVGDDQLRAAGERHGDDRALAHPAGELVRVAVQHRRRETDGAEELLHVGALLVIAHDAAVVGVEGLADLVSDPVHRVPGVHGALEDHRDVLPSPLAHLLGAEVRAGPRR